MDRFRAMQVAVAIADHGSLTGAARALGGSLPAVVRSLAALEAHLGARLFQRTTRRVVATDAGRQYLDHCRRLLALAEEGEAALAADTREPVGNLVVTAPVLFGQMHVAPAVTRFVEAHPKVSVRLMLHDRVVDLLEEGIDVGIRIGELPDSSLVAHPFGTVRRVVVASPALIRKVGAPRHPRDLRERNCIRFTGATAPWWEFQERGRRFTVPVTGNLEFNHFGPGLDACIAGLAFGRFASYQVAPPIAQGRLTAVLEDFEPPARPISIVYPHAQLLPARTRAFIEAMKGAFGGAGPAGIGKPLRPTRVRRAA